MPSNRSNNFRGLIKIAQAPTVGDVMSRINADLSLNSFDRRRLLDSIRGTGLPVSTPASRLMHIGIGAVSGAVLSKYLGFSPFCRGVSTLGAAMYGNKVYNDNLPRYNGFRTNKYY
jgi:hypothetical protein